MPSSKKQLIFKIVQFLILLHMYFMYVIWQRKYNDLISHLHFWAQFPYGLDFRGLFQSKSFCDSMIKLIRKYMNTKISFIFKSILTLSTELLLP